MPSYITATPETSKSILKNAEYFAPPPEELRLRVIRDHYEGTPLVATLWDSYRGLRGWLNDVLVDLRSQAV